MGNKNKKKPIPKFCEEKSIDLDDIANGNVSDEDLEKIRRNVGKGTSKPEDIEEMDREYFSPDKRSGFGGFNEF